MGLFELWFPQHKFILSHDQLTILSRLIDISRANTFMTQNKTEHLEDL